MNTINIMWFRQDLRLSDNPALTQAAANGNVMPIYIVDKNLAIGEASKWWLHHSLSALSESLNGNLSVYQGAPVDVLEGIMARHDVKGVYWNRCYEPQAITRDTKLKEHLKSRVINVETSNGSLLWEPWDIKKDDGTHYKVFTPFYRKGCLKGQTPRTPLRIPRKVTYHHDQGHSLTIERLGLLPTKNWHKKLEPHWNIGEEAAKDRLQEFIDRGLEHYKEGRNLPAKPYVSRLSPHLHFGEISPNQLWYVVSNIANNKHGDHFCSELGWREFSYSQLYHTPSLPEKNLQTKFDHFPWVKDNNSLHAWQHGQTGVPMVDAGMRQLWQTGYMHNRVRMIVGSFLVKNLHIHWHEGQDWFFDTLVDADLANNSASWQWIAGCGADAAPYFRIFNPVTQGQKFDPDGDYVRQFVPEIAALPTKHLFDPWNAPIRVLDDAGITLGKNYPHPIVDLKTSREAALEAFKSLKGNQ